MKKALALLMSLLLAASLNSVAFADGAGLPAPDDTSGLIDVYGQIPAPVPAPPVASEGQTAPPAASSETPESSAPEIPPPEPEVESSAPESASPEPESPPSAPVSSEPESTPESSPPEPESTSSEPESSEPESSSPDNENPDNINVTPPENIDMIDDIPYEPEDTGDIFSARAMSARVMSVPIIPHDPVPPTSLENPAVAIDASQTYSTGSPWIPTDGIPDVEGATISTSTKLVFAIPDNNFATSATTGGSFDANLTNMNAGAIKGLVKVLGPGPSGTDYTPNFDAQFVRVASTGSGRAYGVQLTPKNITAELTLPAGTTFGFNGQVSKFGLSSALLIVSGNSSSKATNITDGAYLGANYTWVTRNGNQYTGGLDVLDDAKAGDEFLIYFSPQFFEWDGNTPAKVTLSNIRSKISLRQTGTTSSRVFETVELTSSKGEAVVRIKFKDNLTSIKPVDFKTTIYLTVKGKRHDDSSLYMEGTFGDEEPEEFYSEDKDIDISDGVIGEAKENISMAKVYIGEGVTLTVPSIRRNSKFYGTVSMDFDKYDEALVEKYPDIIMVYKLHTLGLNGAGVKVDIDTYNGYHIYDKDLNYLGQTALKLPYSDTYYLAASMLDLEEEEEEEEFEPEDLPTENDNPPSKNPNRNPGTGRAVSYRWHDAQ